jgi:hypothetical protein
MPQSATDEMYAVFEINREESIATTVHKLLATACSASRRLVRTSRASGSEIGEMQLKAFIAVSAEERTSVLLLNRPALEACERAGWKRMPLRSLPEPQLPCTRTTLFQGAFCFPVSRKT